MREERAVRSKASSIISPTPSPKIHLPYLPYLTYLTYLTLPPHQTKTPRAPKNKITHFPHSPQACDLVQASLPKSNR